MCETASNACLPPDLLDGIAVFIDDDVYQDGTEANKLKQQIEGKNIPLILRDEIPNPINDFVKHLYGASFIILDWKFLSSQSEPEQIAAGVHFPEDVRTGTTIEFLESLLKTTYCPIFIISQEDIKSIKSDLDKKNITKNGIHPRIFIHGKSELSGGQLFSKLNDWVKNVPITYVLKTWEKAAKEAKLEMFTHLEEKNHSWPQILWKSFEADDSDPAVELTQTLSSIFANRFLFSCSFDSSYFAEGTVTDAQKDIRSVLEGTRFLSVKKETRPAPGDLFEQIENNETIYFLNFRAQCSTVHDGSPELYCIKGKMFDESQLKTSSESGIAFSQGEFRTKKHIILLPFVHGNKIIQLDCRKIVILKYDPKTASLRISRKTDNSKEKPEKTPIVTRVGRVLPPYITHIQQIVSSYIVREGLPAIPDEAIFSGTTTTEPAGK